MIKYTYKIQFLQNWDISFVMILFNQQKIAWEIIISVYALRSSSH